jgi:hypothetical protein
MNRTLANGDSPKKTLDEVKVSQLSLPHVTFLRNLQASAGNRAVQRLLASSTESHRRGILQRQMLQREIKHGKKRDFDDARRRVEASGADVAGALWDAVAWDKRTRPKFFPEIVQKVKDDAEVREQKDAFTGEPTVVAQCQVCKRQVDYQGSSIDHAASFGWKSYLDGFGDSLTRGEAKILYNDPKHLQLVHAGCNSRKLGKQQIVTRSHEQDVGTFSAMEVDK